MKNSTTTKGILTAYYDDLAQKREGWPSLLSEEVVFASSTKTHQGKEAFLTTLHNFMRLVTGMKVKQLISSDDQACAVVNYDLVSPKGKTLNADVAEIWRFKNGKLDSLTIFFDTTAFTNLMA